MHNQIISSVLTDCSCVFSVFSHNHLSPYSKTNRYCAAIQMQCKKMTTFLIWSVDGQTDCWLKAVKVWHWFHCELGLNKQNYGMIAVDMETLLILTMIHYECVFHNVVNCCCLEIISAASQVVSDYHQVADLEKGRQGSLCSPSPFPSPFRNF